MRRSKSGWWRHPACLAGAGAALVILALVGLFGPTDYNSDPALRDAVRSLRKAKAEAASPGSVQDGPFTAPPPDPNRPPHLTLLPLPNFPGANAVWGATGRDARGHIWAGISAAMVPDPSAHLVEYIPEDDQVIDR